MRRLILLAAVFFAMGQSPVQDHPMRVVTFAPGKTSATYAQSLERGSADAYRFSARAGQAADVKITATDGNASFVIYSPPSKATRSADGSGYDIEGTRLPGGDKTIPPLDAGAQKHWLGKLPTSGVYYIEVSTDQGNAEYRLTVTIK